MDHGGGVIRAHGVQEAMWPLDSRGSETVEPGPYPERRGQPDCAYYIRTGSCGFGMTCRYNHPPDRNAVVVASKIKGGYPERVGEPECQYYLKTGNCKFGATCKFHHPKDKAGVAGRVQLNIFGYPLRLLEKECPYYLRTGQCKFWNTCKFHHPQPSSAMVSLHGALYPSVHSPGTPDQQSYPGALTNWPVTRVSFTPSPQWQGPSSFAQLILPQGLVRAPSWAGYPGHLGFVSSPENHRQASDAACLYSTLSQSEEATAGSQGAFSYKPAPIPMAFYEFQKDNLFPERPDQPECQFYMKTGDCKFGAICKFHHPRDRLSPVPNCTSSPLGLPLRPGAPLCIFYARYGICKFGPNCKFDHPSGTSVCSIFPSSTIEDPAVQHLLGSPFGPPAATLSSKVPIEPGADT